MVFSQKLLLLYLVKKAEVSKLIHAHTTALFDNATDNEWRDLN